MSYRARPLLQDKESLCQPSFFPASVSGSWIPRVVVLTYRHTVAGIVYLKEKKLAGLPTGIVYGDASLGAMLVAEPNHRESALAAALEALLARSSVRGLRIVAPPNGLEMSTIQALSTSLPLDLCYTQVENHSLLALPREYDAFLESVGSGTRHNFRRYRQRFEAAGDKYVEEIAFADFEKAAFYLLDQSAIEMDRSALDRALRVLSAVDRPFLAGLRREDGEWLGIAGGWYEPNRAVLFVQMNSDKKHGRSSLSVVLRGYLIEMLMARGVNKLVFWAGAGALNRYAKCISAVAAYVDRPGLAWRLVRRSVASVSATGPARLALMADWIMPRAPQRVKPAHIQAAAKDRPLDETIRAGAVVAAIFIICTVLLYGMPDLAERAMVRYFGPWISYVLVGDLAGSAFLFLLGFRRLAVAVYVTASALEAVLLGTSQIPAASLIWLTNLLPAVLSAGVLSHWAYEEVRKDRMNSAGQPSTA